MKRVVVITGASSGIGRATARLCAAQGCDLALCARGRPALDGVAAECRKYGGRVLVSECNVADEQQVTAFAARVVQEYGKIDAWIQNAGVTALGLFVDMPQHIFRGVIETNFFGTVYGARAALTQFYRQQSGTLITLASVFGMVPSPYESPYVASKFAVRGLTGSLRQEVYLAGLKDVHICTVLPATIDTPIYRHAANGMGRRAVPVPPIYPPKQVARAIYSLLDAPRAEVIVGGAGRGLAGLHALLPSGAFEHLFGRYIRQWHFRQKPAVPTTGNIFTASTMPMVHGRWPLVRRSGFLRLSALGAAAGLWLWHRRSQARRKEGGPT